MMDEMLGSEWHVGDTYPNGSRFEEEDELQIHWYPDPGDGLCSSVAPPMRAELVEHLVELHNEFLRKNG